VNGGGRLRYFACFVGLAVTTAFEIARIGMPSIAGLLTTTAVVASLAGAPGLIRRRAWPVALVLLPLGAYLLALGQAPIPATVSAADGRVGFLLDQLQAGAGNFLGEGFPLDFAAASHVQLVVVLGFYATIGIAAFVTLSLRRALPGLVIILAALGFGFTTDHATRVVWAPLAFIFFGSLLLALSRTLDQDRPRVASTLLSAVTTVIAAIVALVLLAATPVGAG